MGLKTLVAGTIVMGVASLGLVGKGISEYVKASNTQENYLLAFKDAQVESFKNLRSNARADYLANKTNNLYSTTFGLVALGLYIGMGAGWISVHIPEARLETSRREKELFEQSRGNRRR